MKKTFTILTFLLIAQLSFGQLITHKNVVKGSYNFWVHVPEDRTQTDSTLIPAVLFLHGRSLCGTDMAKVRKYGCLDALRYGLDIPAIVIAPQNPGESWNPSKLMKLLEWSEKHYPIDTNRVYVLGMSLGGYGTIDFAGTYPDKVAAAMALCGGGTIKDYKGLNEVPLWIIHGIADEAVPWKASQSVVDGMKAVGDTTRLLYDLHPKVNHGKLARVFYLNKTYDWLFSHSLTDSLRAVNRDYEITVPDMDSAYKAFYGQPKKDLKVYAFKNESVIEPSTEDASTPSVTYSGDAVYYTVRKGDSLSKIAVNQHTTVAKLCSLNGISKDSIIRIGQKLRVK